MHLEIQFKYSGVKLGSDIELQGTLDDIFPRIICCGYSHIISRVDLINL